MGLASEVTSGQLGYFWLARFRGWRGSSKYLNQGRHLPDGSISILLSQYPPPPPSCSISVLYFFVEPASCLSQ